MKEGFYIIKSHYVMSQGYNVFVNSSALDLIQVLPGRTGKYWLWFKLLASTLDLRLFRQETRHHYLGQMAVAAKHLKFATKVPLYDLPLHMSTWNGTTTDYEDLMKGHHG